MCTKDFVAADGRNYQINLSDNGEEITVLFDNQKVGSISLMYCEGCGYNDYFYHIMYLDLKSCKRLGIGTACLQYHIEIFEASITAASAYGPSMDDGSHLIEDGIPFIAKMRSLKIVSPEPSESEGDLDTDEY